MQRGKNSKIFWEKVNPSQTLPALVSHIWKGNDYSAGRPHNDLRYPADQCS